MKNKPLCYRIGKGLVDFAIGSVELIRRIADYVKEEPLCFTYPILGNLSGDLQERIETLTNGAYNAKAASTLSTGLTSLAYVVSPAIMSECFRNGDVPRDFDSRPEVLLTIPAGIYAVCELLYRVYRLSGQPVTKEEKRFTRRGEELEKKPCASLPGKIASLPLELLVGVYDGVKEKTKTK